MLREFVLISFTILVQMSVGAFIVLNVVKLFAARKAGQEAADKMGDRSLVAIIVVLGLGLLASLFHLGSPLSAPRAVTNLATSWLSREILFGVIFAVLGFLYTLMQLFKWGSAGLRTILAWITALVGLVLVYSMSMVYMLPTQPAWNSVATPISFFTTTLLLGGLAMGVAYSLNYAYVQKKDPGCADEQCELLRVTLRWIAIASMFLLGIEFVVIPSYLVSLAVGSPQAVASAALIAGPLGLAFFFRLVLAFIGAGVFGLFLFRSTQKVGAEKAMANIVIAAFLFVLVAEVLGRYLFYSSQVAITL
jgi:anaerobic dimethyl sulfoxide reductase subunit C (anchor subunit)